MQVPRRSLPASSNSTALSAMLTVARSQYEMGGFPYLLGQETNSSGTPLWGGLCLSCLSGGRAGLTGNLKVAGSIPGSSS